MPFLNYLAVQGNSLTGILPASIFSMQYLIACLAVRLGAPPWGSGTCLVGLLVHSSCFQLHTGPLQPNFWWLGYLAVLFVCCQSRLHSYSKPERYLQLGCTYHCPKQDDQCPWPPTNAS